MRTANWLKEQRVKQALTQSQLAIKLGLSRFAIENIEQGKRLGSAETWKKIEDYFTRSEYDDLETSIQESKISYESDELIKELKEDIEEFGEDHHCILVYKTISEHIFFTNYDFITEENPFDPKTELEKGEKYIETTFKYALEVFEAQNKTL